MTEAPKRSGPVLFPQHAFDPVHQALVLLGIVKRARSMRRGLFPVFRPLKLMHPPGRPLLIRYQVSLSVGLGQRLQVFDLLPGICHRLI